MVQSDPYMWLYVVLGGLGMSVAALMLWGWWLERGYLLVRKRASRQKPGH